MILRLALAGLLLTAAHPVAASQDECAEEQLLQLAGCVDLDTVMADDLQISKAHLPHVEHGSPEGTAFLMILNRGAEEDRLVSATSLIAGRVEFAATVDGDLTILPGERLAMSAGGPHLALHRLSSWPALGDDVEITLEFENAGHVVIDFRVTESGETTALRP